jgi:hypothetical protein
MRAPSYVIALAAFVLASPNPQDIDFDLVYKLPNPNYATTASTVKYDATSILAAALPEITSSINAQTATTLIAAATGTVQKRDTACQPQPAGATAAPLVADSPSAFVASSDFASAANNAAMPSGYTKVFQNLQASNK